MLNALSIDLEEWFCGHILQQGLDGCSWNEQELRARENVWKLMRILDKKRAKATFFVLGWLAERIPEMIKEIEQAGHEIATHGYFHISITEMKPSEFERDLQMSIDVIHKYVNCEIIGYRAPHFTITRKTLWALNILAATGLKYDSSVFPIGFHPDYGINDAELSIHNITPTIIEVPLSAVKILGVRIPCAGGGYFRLYPYKLTKKLLQTCNRQGRPIVFYLHPWELDPDQPKLKLSLMSRLRHYTNLDKTADRLQRLLDDFKFTSIRKVLDL